MSTQFNVGDLVQLKSGGPSMTVTKVHESGQGRITVETSWFSENKLENGQFPPETLQLDTLELPKE